MFEQPQIDLGPAWAGRVRRFLTRALVWAFVLVAAAILSMLLALKSEGVGSSTVSKHRDFLLQGSKCPQVPITGLRRWRKAWTSRLRLMPESGSFYCACLQSVLLLSEAAGQKEQS